MIATRESAVGAFVECLLAREGALVDRESGRRLFAVLPPELAAALALPESASVRLFGDPKEGEVALPLESAGMEWCIERAAARGRLACVRLPTHATPKPAGAALKRFTALNGTVRSRGSRSRVATIHVWVLEFRYEACSEERAEGSVFLAVAPDVGAVSVPLAGALLQSLDHAEPVARPPHAPDFEALARGAEPVARAEIDARLARFKEDRLRRLSADRERLLAYHDTLLSEASRRRAAEGGEQALREKAEAIVRQRDAKLAELAERHSVAVRYALSSALLASYEAPVCDLVVRRRQREISVELVWDPFLHEPLPLACTACRAPALAFHVCDDAGHLTCASCAAKCPGCGRVTCHACHGPGCRGCGRS